MHQEATSRGRPRREPIEVARTAAWYHVVKKTSRLSESKLEIRFDDCDREAIGKHRGSRWNKYKFGRCSPSRALLEKVDAVYPGTLGIYDHVVWELANSHNITSGTLRGMIERLPSTIAELFIDPAASPNSPFWLNADLDHSKIIKALLRLRRQPNIGYFPGLAGLLVLAHDGLIRQREAQHFDAHVALAKEARSMEWPIGQPLSCRFEAIVIGAWLETEYRDPVLRAIIEDLRHTNSGPMAPWQPYQATLSFAPSKERHEQQHAWELKAFWVTEKLARTDSTCGFEKESSQAK